MTILLKRLFLYVAIPLSIFITIVVINQTIQITNFASTINPTFGSTVLYSLLTLYGVLLLVPLIAIVRLPKVIPLTADENSPEFEAYMALLKKRLANNRHLKDSNLTLNSRADVETALKVLDSKADDIMKTTASSMFVSTAISQNGALDALLVLMGQMKMIWQITHLYNQRPAWSEIVKLYMNVIATTFAASQIEDLDISSQVEPMISSAFSSSVATAIPGVGAVANILVTSTLNGSANAFLTLRVGIITKQYSAPLTSPDKKSVIKSASLQAAAILGNIISESTKEVLKAAKEAVKKITSKTANGVYNSVASGTDAVVDASKKATEVVTKVTTNMASDVYKNVASGTDAMVDASKKATEVLTEVTTNIASDVYKNVASGADAVVDASKKATEVLTEVTTDMMASDVYKNVASGADAMVDASKKATEVVTTVTADMASDVYKNVASGADAVVDAGKKVTEAVTTVTADMASDVYKNVASGTETMVNAGKKVTEAVTDGVVGEAISKGTTAAKDACKRTGEALVDVIDASKAKEAVATGLDQASNVIKNVGDKGTEALLSIFKKVKKQA